MSRHLKLTVLNQPNENSLLMLDFSNEKIEMFEPLGEISSTY